MRTRTLARELRPQEDNLADARDDLRRELASLQAAAKDAWRALASDRGTPDLDAVYAAVTRVRETQEGYDLATYDLSTASGEDG